MADNTTDDRPAQEIWEAPQIETALAHLERLQNQLDGFRSAIPGLVAPLVTKQHQSKAQMFTAIRKAAVATTDDMKALRESWSSEQTQQVLAKVQESLKENPDLNKAYDVPRWGWAEEEEEG